MERKGATASADERRARAKALLQEVGLPPELIDRYPAQLSGGQKQRVNIARALCVTPRLIVADEIVSGLDVSVQAQILNLLLDLRAERGVGLVFISHDLAVVRYLCSRLLVMREGVVVEEGETEAIFRAPQHAYTRALMAAAPPEDLDRAWPAEAAEMRWGAPSPIAGEGVMRSMTDEGYGVSHPPVQPGSISKARSAIPLIRPSLTRRPPSPARGEGKAPYANSPLRLAQRRPVSRPPSMCPSGAKM